MYTLKFWYFSLNFFFFYNPNIFFLYIDSKLSTFTIGSWTKKLYIMYLRFLKKKKKWYFFTGSLGSRPCKHYVELFFNKKATQQTISSTRQLPLREPFPGTFYLFCQLRVGTQKKYEKHFVITPLPPSLG